MHGIAASRRQLLAYEAEAWLRQNQTRPLTIADLCQAVQTSERTLHSAFRERLGTTPKLRLKALRLEAARRELLRGTPGTRITDVALNWGFLHFGWFSHDYRRCFGETPSDTLRRAGRLLREYDLSQSFSRRAPMPGSGSFEFGPFRLDARAS